MQARARRQASVQNRQLKPTQCLNGVCFQKQISYLANIIIFELQMAHVKIEEQKIPKSLTQYQHTIKVNSPYQKRLFTHKIGHWSSREQGKYYAFVERFSDKFGEKESRRQWKVFKAMANFIKSRDPHQCRSHHHKMTRKFRTIPDTLAILKNKDPLLEKQSQIYQKQLDRIQISAKKDGVFPVPSQPQIFYKKQEKISFEPDQYDPIQIPKTFDIGSLRTDASEKLFDCRYTDQRSQTSRPIPAMFPSTGLLGSSFLNQPLNNYQQSNQVPFQAPPNDILSFFENESRREKEVVECHKMFLKWISKLTELMGADNEE